MVFVENKRKELKSSYKADTAEVGVQMHLIPEGINGVKSNVNKRDNTGIG